MPTLSQHVCFDCRKVFKKPHFYAPIHAKKEEIKWPAPYRCPECGHDMTYMGYKFRAPRMADMKEWKRIEDGVRQGLDWTKPTRRKEKPKPQISHALKKALGIQIK